MNLPNILTKKQTPKEKDLFVEIRENGVESLSQMADIATEAPIVGGIIKFFKFTNGIREWFFFKKFEKFLIEKDSIDEETQDAFFNNLSREDYKRITGMILYHLEKADEEEKATIIGKIYKSAVIDQITKTEMLRLTAIVSSCFLDDLFALENYIDENEDVSYVTNNLYSQGLLEDCGNIYNYDDGEFVGQKYGPTKHKLNDLGQKLLKILSS